MQKKSNEFVAIGLMLFALFFGAGNLIFPVFMGQNAGINVTWATLGFLITGVGLPFAGVLAVCYSGDDLQNLASRVAPWYGVAFTVLLYLTIGPFFAIPRTATVSYEIAVAPLLGPEVKSIGLYAFAFVLLVAGYYPGQDGKPYRQGYHSVAACFPGNPHWCFLHEPDGCFAGSDGQLCNPGWRSRTGLPGWL